MSKIKVTDIKDSELKIKVDKSLSHLVPSTVIPHHFEFTLHNVSNAISNAIRRTIMCELPVYHLQCAYEDIKTNDAHIIPEMLQKRLMMIPIIQSVDKSTKFELDAVNSTALALDVKSGEFKNTKGKSLPFNDTFTFVTLNPGKFIKITGITISSGIGFVDGQGMLSLAVNAASLAQDQEPLNSFEKTGIPSREADPRVWLIKFNTNGTMPPRDLIKYACDNIHARLLSLLDILDTIDSSDDQYVLGIHGESDTMGNLMMKTILELYPDIAAVTYNVSSVERLCLLKVKCDEDINTVLTTTIKHLLKVFNDIKALF